jgi:hypothetical protein
MGKLLVARVLREACPDSRAREERRFGIGRLLQFWVRVRADAG